MLSVVFPIVLAAGFHLYVMYQADYQKAEQAALATVRSIAFQHNAQVEGVRNLLTALSRLPEVKNSDRKACTALIRDILRQSPSTMNIGIADLNGNLIATGVPAAFKNGDRKYFRDALRTRRFSAGEYVVSRAVGKPAINFALPVLNSAGEPTASLYVTFDLNQFDSIFDAQKLPPNSVLDVTDHRGAVLHRYPFHDIVKSGILDRPDLRRHVTGPDDEGVFAACGLDGAKRLLAFKRLRLNPDAPPYIYIRVTTPESSILSGVNRFIARSAVLFFLVTILALALSHFVVGRFFVSPIERMASVARAVTDGDLSIRTGLHNSGAEIGLMAKSFDTMTAALDDRLRESARAEEQIKAQDAQLRALIDNLPFDLWAMDKDGRYFMQNTKCRDSWGDLIGKIPEETSMAKNILAVWQENNRRAFAGEVVKGEVEYTVNGERHFFFNIIAPIKSDHSVLGIIGVNIDISNLKSLEDQLYQAQKLEAVGQLAGGVAHEFNNILTAVTGYAHLVATNLTGNDHLQKYIGQISNCADRAADLTRGLLAFSRKQIMLPQVVNLNDVVGRQEKMLRMLVDEYTDLQLEMVREELSVLADAGKIEQVLMNLVMNANDAVPSGGSIVISTSSITFNDQSPVGPGSPGSYACIAVKDTGCGMDLETRKKIFEPFFTTKEVGKGTGLGLAIVYGIVKQHNGFVTVDSEPGNWTVFRIYLPLADGEAETRVGS